jgi:hypothetical protein
MPCSNVAEEALLQYLTAEYVSEPQIKSVQGQVYTCQQSHNRCCGDASSAQSAEADLLLQPG